MKRQKDRDTGKGSVRHLLQGDSVCQRPQSLPILMKTMILTLLTKCTTWHLAVNSGLDLLRKHNALLKRNKKNHWTHYQVTDIMMLCDNSLNADAHLEVLMTFTLNPWYSTHTFTDTLSVPDAHSKKTKLKHNDWICKYTGTPRKKVFLTIALNK